MSTAAAMRTAVMNGSVPSAVPRLRLTKRGRAVLTTLAALPLIASALVFGLNGGMATATSTSSSTAFQYVTVEAGQSLWQLALQVAPSADPREVISDVVHLNQLPNSDVQAGQRLAIPLRYSN